MGNQKAVLVLLVAKNGDCNHGQSKNDSPTNVICCWLADNFLFKIAKNWTQDSTTHPRLGMLMGILLERKSWCSENPS